jgi:hypothetical protein
MARSRHSRILALGIALSGAAGGSGCSSDPAGMSFTCDVSGKNTGGLIDVQGGVIFHSMNKLASGRSGKAIDATGLAAEVVDLGDLAEGAELAPLSEASLSGDECVNATSGSCGFCFVDTNIEGNTEGVGVSVRDTRTSDKLWLTTVRGAASAEDLAALQSAGAPLDTAWPFAVTRDALDTVVAELTGVSGDELMKRGVIFGLIYSTPSTSEASGEPVAGATVTPSDGDVTVVYPTTKFNGVGSTTGGQGAFIAFPSAPGAATTTTFTVNAPSGETHTWDAAQVAHFAPGVMYFYVTSPEQ